jgi:prevent-host-death family protein
MRYAIQVKSIGHLKANTEEVMRDLSERREPVIITQHGEARAVLQDVASWDATQETLVLLKLLAIGQRDVEAGEVIPIAQAVERIRAHDP